MKSLQSLHHLFYGTLKIWSYTTKWYKQQSQIAHIHIYPLILPEALVNFSPRNIPPENHQDFGENLKNMKGTEENRTVR